MPDAGVVIPITPAELPTIITFANRMWEIEEKITQGMARIIAYLTFRTMYLFHRFHGEELGGLLPQACTYRTVP